MIIGSTALEYFGMNRRKPKDVDTFYHNIYAMTEDTDSHKIPQEIYDLIPTIDVFATPEAILTLKMSHLQWDIKWWKTFQDILFLKEKHKIKYNKSLYNTLVQYWKTVHGDKSFLSLEKSKEDFFTDKVNYLMDHDLLHEKVSYPNEPIYKKCLKDNADVAIDKKKFDSLDFEEQLTMFKEEIAVIALERYLLNNHNNVDNIPRAYQLALKKTITNLTKGWASDFIIFNIEKFIDIPLKMFYNVLNEEEKEMSENLQRFKEYLKTCSEFEDDKDTFVVELANGCAVDGINVVQQEGGGEGGTEYCEAVFEWKESYFKINYSYYSHNGYESDGAFESIIEVQPHQETITVFK